MRKTAERMRYELKSLTVSAETLAAMLDCGRPTAMKIGEDPGAKIKIGKRTLYRVSAIEDYLDKLAESE